MKTWKIKAGNHNSGIHFYPTLNKKNLKYTVIFNESAKYDIRNENKYDLNKLFGLSFGFHHNNSVRFGWRTINNEYVEIHSYCYVNSKRIKSELITVVNFNEPYFYEINVLDNSYQLNVNSFNGIRCSVETEHYELPCWGYHLFPYFGGNSFALDNILIKYSKENLLI